MTYSRDEIIEIVLKEFTEEEINLVIGHYIDDDYNRIMKSIVNVAKELGVNVR